MAFADILRDLRLSNHGHIPRAISRDYGVLQWISAVFPRLSNGRMLFHPPTLHHISRLRALGSGTDYPYPVPYIHGSLGILQLPKSRSSNQAMAAPVKIDKCVQ